MKGVSIPINTLVMLAVAIIVLLATVAWFMGAFGPAATEETRYQKFKTNCTIWVLTNCEDKSSEFGADCDDTVHSTTKGVNLPYSSDNPNKWCVPLEVYNAYKEWRGEPKYFKDIALECGCSEPFGIG